MTAESKSGVKNEERRTETELPADPIEFARTLKRVVSEDFLRSYKAIRKVVIRH